MRWIIDPVKSGDSRVTQRFLFFPYRIGREIRWLERVKIKQIFCNCRTVDGDLGWWSDVEFID